MNKIGLIICLFSFHAVANCQVASFTYSTSNGSFCNPSTVHFTQTATGNPVGYIWNFGNGRNSHSRNPTVIYNAAGTYTVKLIVVYSQGTSEATNTITIDPTIDPLFTMDKQAICLPGVINFSASGNGSVESYTWDFGDGSPVTSSGVKDISHNYSTYGDYKVILTVKSTAGCDSSSSQLISVQKPAIAANISAIDGCIPATINFDASVSVLPGDAVSSYLWDYGDGSPPINTLTGNTSHIYNVTGAYLPTLTISTLDGCTNNYSYSQVAFGIPPTNLVAYTNKNVICGSEKAIFIGKALNANSYTWSNSETVDIVTDTISTHKYKTIGIKKIVVVPSFNGCNGLADSFNITVIGVISNFAFSNTCSNRITFNFLNRTSGTSTSNIWNFGDGSPTNNSTNTVHTFPVSGLYTASLIVADSITGCADTSSKQIFTTRPLLNNPDQSICANSLTTFTVTNVDTTNVNLYFYHGVGRSRGVIFPTSYTFRADSLGVFDNFVTVQRKNTNSYCLDTAYLDHRITVRGPRVSFTSPDSICLNTLLNVTNKSSPFFPTDTIVFWDWNFGDGSLHVSTAQPQPYEYSNPGVYNVTLTATDINGCKNVFGKKVAVSENAFVYTLPRIDTLCQGQSAQLIAFQNDMITWSPANSVSCVNCDTVMVNPSQTTTFYATSSNAFGCSARDSVLVKVYPPFTATTPVSNIYICPGEAAHLDAAPAGYNILWSPASGLSNPAIYNPTATPVSTTIYTATLSDSVGCFTSNVNVTVHVKSLPLVDAGPDAYYPFNSVFTITPVYSSNIAAYLWSPAAQLNCTTCPSPSGTIIQKQTYTIAVTSDSGCVSKDSVTIFVECKDANLRLPNAFTPNNDNLNDVFYPLGYGIQTILNFSVYSREGKLVYQRKNFPPNTKSFGWDGTLKGQQFSTAVFVFIVEALCDSGEKLVKKGPVTLIR